ncbi:hypothetical protein NLG97_g691 [Lecanicillium saksenae]|uniref:Uncharacterized protein n=1 Tax=Lecanicillium saksenae TaxID=468837 RepID=A0ACC1R5V9_9HYPO|nr:hypothetical protein NLG97_g691 [Lecanicillium saksenae]
MARFVNLELEEDGGDAQDPSSRGQPTAQNLRAAAPPPAEACPTTVESMTPTVCNAVTRAFQCYPIVVGIISHIDLTTLDSLARTSRLIHYGLVQYSSALVASTLRCSNESSSIVTEELPPYAAVAGKASRCARDMNCVIKPPASNTLRQRHRRLCAPCTKAPLEKVACPGLDMSLPRSSELMQRYLCDCEKDGVWLCQPCGRTMRNADDDYIRIWRWRNHYGEVLGCLGTGIGDADRGVICGREEHCLGAREREQEIDCDAEDARSSRTPAKSDNPEFGSTLSSTMPMAAMFTRNKFVGWAGVVFSIQNWLGESAETKKNGTPGYFNVGLSVMALGVTYMPLFMPPPDRSGTATGAPAPVAAAA